MMRIHKVTFENLNSLYGRHSIDFDAPNIKESGIFLIFGPMGSGKTTILDAITLALFGKTPRLSSKPGSVLMSNGTGYCASEVEFSSDGVTYLAFWSQATARQKAGANLLDAKVELAIKDGAILETKVREYYDKVEEIIHLDYNQFTTSVMLPQGQFASFLLENGSARAPILEQITQTGIYSNISKAVQKRFAQEQKELDSLKKQLEVMSVFSDEERASKLQELSDEQARSAGLQQEINVLEDEAKAWNEINRKSNQACIILQESQNLSETMATHRNDLARLDAYQHISFLVPRYDSLKEKEHQVTDSLDAITKKNEMVKETAKAEEQAFTNLETAKSREEAWKEEKERRLAIIFIVEALDKQISTETETFETKKETVATVGKKYENALEKQQEADESYAEDLKNFTTAEAWLHAHQADASLPSLLSGLTEASQTLEKDTIDVGKKSEQIQKQKEQLASEKETLERLLKKKNAQEENISTDKGRQQEVQDRIDETLDGRSLAALFTMKGELEKSKADLTLYISLEERRKTLEDGKPCPLCGSTTHPYAVKTPPLSSHIDDEIEKVQLDINMVTTLQDELTKGEERIKRASDALEAVKQETAEAQTKVRQTELQLTGWQSQREEDERQLKEEQQKLLEKVSSYGITMWTEHTLGELQKHSEAWTNQKEQKDALLSALLLGSASINTTRIKVDELSEALENAITERDEAKRTVTQMIGKRRSSLGDITIQQAKQTIEKQNASEEENLQKASSTYQTAHDAAEKAKSALSTEEEHLSAFRQEAEKSRNQFMADLLAQGIDGETAFEAKLLNKTEEQRITEIKNTITASQTRLKTLKDTYAQEPDVQEPERSEEEVKKVLNERNQSSQESNKKIGAFQNDIANDDSNRKKYHTQQEKIANQETITNDWSALNTMIGSADGKKFRDYAQAITFRKLLLKTNEELSLLSDRYFLADDADKPLEFYVLDGWQANAKRPARSLSGGESFIVSLALALGLSSMNAGKVKIDSLFLDEGFGTLNPQEIEPIISSLTRLEEGGKTIGIISHVPILQDYIPARIEAVRNSNGKSTLQGCGVSN